MPADKPEPADDPEEEYLVIKVDGSLREAVHKAFYKVRHAASYDFDMAVEHYGAFDELSEPFQDHRYLEKLISWIEQGAEKEWGSKLDKLADDNHAAHQTCQLNKGRWPHRDI